MCLFGALRRKVTCFFTIYTAFCLFNTFFNSFRVRKMFFCHNAGSAERCWLKKTKILYKIVVGTVFNEYFCGDLECAASGAMGILW